ncbi:MAG: hypothetical protein H0W66_10510 [Chthoniobacterales bacterium]|nr:hypothetical protein [Chthoniobacterales bacterium]
MKTLHQLVVLLGGIILVPVLTTVAHAGAAPKTRDLSVRVASPTGSLLGGGYVSTYLTSIRARTIGKEDGRLRNAIVSLDGLGMLQVRGFGLVPAAVAWQSEMPMRKVIQQQAASGLSYGELLMANTIAARSGESFATVVGLRAKSRTWGTLTEQLGVSTDEVVAKVNTAARRIIAVDFRSRSRALRETGTNYSATNSHTQQARLH